MSGHSKFANIKHKKEKNDAKKGKIFTVIGRELVMAVKAGGPDPNNNSKLRDVIAKAKANNMPNDTIDRGIKKAAGADSADNYEKAVYEGYGPNGVAIIVETLTDNKNRTAGNVRNAFTKGNGSIGTQGCVSYMFDQKGQIIIDKEECEMDADEIMMLALDAGAEDFSEEEDSYEVLTAPDDFSTVREALDKAGLPIAEAQVAMIPQTYVELTDEQALKDLQRTLDLLDDDDDVTAVSYTHLHSATLVHISGRTMVSSISLSLVSSSSIRASTFFNSFSRFLCRACSSFCCCQESLLSEACLTSASAWAATGAYFSVSRCV